MGSVAVAETSSVTAVSCTVEATSVSSYVAATGAAAYSGRAHEYYPYAGFSLGITK